MDNLRQQIEPALHRKGVPIKKMCQEIGITEQTFHRGMRENSMSMKNFRKIKDYLGIEENTNEKLSSANNSIEYWKGLMNQLSAEITDLRMENWTLKKELGKFNSICFALNI